MGFTATFLMLALTSAASAQETSAPSAPSAPSASSASSAPEEPVAPRLTPEQRAAINNAALPDDQAAMKAHVMFLASDAMKGRDTGSAEFDIAAEYVAAQFYAAGLRPAGDAGSYLQKVPLVAYSASDKGSLVLERPGQAPLALEFSDEYLPAANPAQEALTMRAPVVFVGYGITAPALNDYAGVNVKGKIVAYFAGAPKYFPSEERAHFGSAGTKLEMAARQGAIGAIEIESPATARLRPFSRQVRTWADKRMTWADTTGTGHSPAAGTPSLATLSLAGGEKLLSGMETPWAKLLQISEADNGRFRAEPLKAMLAVTTKTAISQAASYNVAGILPGSDPRLKEEIVVLSAHLDHVGVGRPVDGDTIYNGALDNAVGIATLIEEAKRFKAAGKVPRRSILFLAVTGEEKGLVGSDYFARFPTVPKANLVANINFDMPIITARFDDMIAFGAEHSNLGEIVKKTAAGIGMMLSPDPIPEQRIFVRSDHYRFVQQGIPAVFIRPGQAGDGKEAGEEFRKLHYHKPSDDIAQQRPILWDQGVRFVEINYLLARGVADAEERPRWNKGDFFGLLYNGFGAK